jgi:amino acid adenylation domain-containing protein/non-ribosomal peptide synthase protein (TIGR01720 family)
LSKQETKLLQQGMNAKNKVETDAILLAALSRSLKATFGVENVRVLLEGHGREEYLEKTDISRTVGWFTSMYPFVLNSAKEDIESVLLLQDALSNQLPDKGVGYGLLRYISEQALPTMEDAQVTFNYLGDFTREEAPQQTNTSSNPTTNRTTFSYSEYGHGLDVHPNLSRESELEVSGQSEGGCLQMSIQYSGERMDEGQMQELATSYKAQLLQISKALTEYEKTVQLPGNFTYKGLTLEQIVTLEKEYGGIEDVYRLSPMQQGLYYHALSEPDSHAYFEQFGYALKGDLDIAKLEQAYRTLVQRHGVLRTVFRNDLAEEPLQVVLKEGVIDFRVEDISDRSAEEQQYLLNKIADDSRKKGFDCEIQNLFRLIVVNTGDSFELIWQQHHLILDGWSNALLMEEFLNIVRTEKVLHIETTPKSSFSEYIKWLDQYDEKQATQYWKKYLNGYDAIAKIPETKKQVSEGKYQRAVQNFSLTKEQTHQLNDFVVQNKYTLNSVFQAVFGFVLSKYSNLEDVVFGSVVSGRPDTLEGGMEMIGNFINTIPVRLTLNSEGTFSRKDINAVQKSFIESKDFHFSPLAVIQNQIGTPSLINHIIVFENYPSEGNDSDVNQSIQISQSNIEPFAQTGYDLSLTVFQSDCFCFECIYNTSVYDSTLLERFGNHLVKVLCELDEKIKENGRIKSFIDTEEIEYFKKLNPNPSSFNQTTVIERFSEIAKTHQEATAIIKGDKLLSYQELDEQSNRFAQYLLSEYGLEKGDLAGIKLDRSVEMVVSVLGVLKTGAAYVPIDTAYPKERIAYMEKDGGCKVVLDEEEWESFHLQRTLYPTQSPDVQLTSQDAMYVIYTSGSTGNPKGCVLNYEGVSNYLDWTKEYVKDLDYSEVDFFSSLSFDFTVTSLFGALTQGKALRMYDAKEDLSVQLNRIALNPESGWIKLTPAHINLIDEQTLKAARSKVFVLGGEALTEEQINHLRKNEGCRIYNEYGPTEATVGCIVKEIDSDNAPYIGTPIPNTEAYLLDNSHNLVPYGSIGEICIGGLGLARGYLNREELTKEKFIDNPYKPGERLYRTGDLGRWREDGNLEYLGRIDDQVKIRGYRIELGEIEQAISTHKTSGQAVVIARAINTTTDKELIAYTTGEATAEELKSYLKDKLPSYMVPNYYVKLESIPLTSNGKVDRKSLPDPEGTGFKQGDYVVPKTDTEKQLVKIWSEVLRAKEEEIGLESDFFALGGDSIKAINLISKIQKTFGCKFLIAEIFKHSKITYQANKIDLLSNQIKSDILVL